MFRKEFIEQTLQEQAIAMKGDWQEGIDKISTTSETVIKIKWRLLDNIKIPKLNKTYEFRQLNNSLEFILGYWDTETLDTKLGKETKPVFETIFSIGLTRYKSLGNILKYKKLINVDGVAVLKEYTGKGISSIIYKYLVNDLNYTILGDEEQYFGARKLWARLSKELDVKVDIIDAKSKTLIHSNIVLHHGNYDEDFDNTLWSYKDDKKYLRSVLTKIL
ncbi:MAG TPA: hypothetical protein EYH42_03235 [Sulfurovum sp.]|nr:hypothetical protein [Sulfurovum sp.]